MRIPVRYLRRQRPLLFCLLLVLTVPLIASGQAEVKLDGGNGGRNTLQGDLITPNGQRLDHPVMVRLTTQRGEITTTSNGNGSFVFRQLSGGRYTVRIDASDGYAPAMEVVDVSDSGSGGAMSRIGQTFTVQIHLRLASGQPVAKGVVSANDPPKAAIDLYNKALISVKDGHRDKAIEQLKGAIAIYPQFVAALNGLGVQYMKLGNHQAAFDAFSSALKLSPDSFILHLNCGVTLFHLNRPAEAELELAAALLKNEASGTAHLYRARALIALNRLDDAEKDLKRAVEIGGDDVKLAHRYLAGIHMEKGETTEAVKQLELYLKAAPDSKESDQIKNLIKELNKKAGRE
jgi:Tfp pilus assembly protein PilF